MLLSWRNATVLTLGRVVVANLLDGTANDLLVVNGCAGCDLAEHHHHARLGRRLCGRSHVSGWKWRCTVCEYTLNDATRHKSRMHAPHATRELGSRVRKASSTASDTWSHSLSAHILSSEVANDEYIVTTRINRVIVSKYRTPIASDVNNDDRQISSSFVL